MSGRRRRRRARGGSPPPRPERATPPRPPAPARAPGRARLDERPKAPWEPFPLVELCVLIGLALIGVGLFSEGRRAAVALACGLALASIAGLEVALREHLAGFRSHSLLLAGAAALTVGVGSAFLVTRVAALALAAVVFLAAFLALRRRFRTRAGVSFRA